MSQTYTTTVTLPSLGMLYPEQNICDITLRNITTAEEKVLYGSTSDKALDMVIQDCVVAPRNLDLESLLLPDKHYLMMKLRTHSFGSDYHASHKCPHCGETHEYKVNLDELPVHTMEDNQEFTEPHELDKPLPVSGDKIEIRLLRGTDLTEIDREAKRMKKQFKNMKGDISYILRLMRYIVSVNGQELDKGSKQKYVETLHGRDSAFIWDRINKIKLGIDTMIYETCAGCGEDVEFVLPITSEFFRPRFDD